MSPNSPKPDQKRSSGNPATQSQINLTVKQQREQKHQEKLAAQQRQLAKRRRSKVVWWTAGSAAAVVVIGAIVASIVFAPPPPVDYQAGGTGAKIKGVQTYENTTLHVTDPVDYPQTPPAGGPHNPVWLNCGIYSQPVPNENAVHSMEHGAIWVTYDADKLSASQLATLKSKLPSTYVVLSPFVGLPSPLVLTGWNHQLPLDSVDDPRIEQFFEEYWRNQNAPEPSAACTGGLDAPGKEG
jgi:Protein of unknown function (DUF3105)